jgi:hypothetical protein
MANIPLTDIPNAPQSGTPTMQNVNIPTVNLGFAERQIKEAYQGQMVSMEAAGAPGKALAAVGQDMVNISSLTTDTMRKYVEMEDATATVKFLSNLDGIRNELKIAKASTDPAMYPVLVKKAYEDKERLYQGIGNIGRQMVAADALRAETNDMAESSFEAHMATKSKEKANALYAMQSNMQSGRFEDADVINDNLLTIQAISAREHAANRININNGQQMNRFMDIVNATPKEAMRMVQNSLVSGEPIPGFDGISSPESLSKLTRIAEAADVFQTADKMEAVSNLIDSYTITSVDALNANPVFMQLDPKAQDALRSRVVDIKVGTPEAEVATKQAANIVDKYPSGENVVAEYQAAHNWIIANVPGPFAESLIKKLDDKKDALAANAGQLPPAQDLERHAANLLDAYKDGGVLGALPDNKEKGTPTWTARMLEIQRREADLKEAVRLGNPKTRAEVEEIIATKLTPDEAKKLAQDAKPGLWNWLFPPGAKPLPPQTQDADTPLPPLVPPQASTRGFKPATATSFGTLPDGSRDSMDPNPSKYLGKKTHDPNFMAASLSKKALAEEGIPVDQAGNYDVIVRSEKTGKEVRVPIGDLGPAEWVEDRQGRTVDFTGAVHRALGTKGKDRVVYRVVPRALQEG